MKNPEYNKSTTIFNIEKKDKVSFFRRTQIAKAIESPKNLNPVSFKDIEKKDELFEFKKEVLLEEFQINETNRNRSLANLCILGYSFLFFINCAISTVYLFFASENEYKYISSYFYLGVYVLLANFIFYLFFEHYANKFKKIKSSTLHNIKVCGFCFAMTIAQIYYIIDLDSNPLYNSFKFSYIWGNLHYPAILFMLICLLNGFFVKTVSIFIIQLTLIVFVLLSERDIYDLKIIYIVLISLFYVLFSLIFVYLEEIHLKEKYEYFLNFKKSTNDWQDIINNVPYGICLFQKEHPHNLIFSNNYGNEVLEINISDPFLGCLETLSKRLGELKRVAIENSSGLSKHTAEIASEQKIEISIHSARKLGLLFAEKTSLVEIFSKLDQKTNNNNDLDKTTVVYQTQEKIKVNTSRMFKEDKKFSIKLKTIMFEKQKTFLLIIEDSSQNDLIVSLRENNAYKSKLLSSFSHEIKTPLNGALPLLKNIYNDQNFERNEREKHYQLKIAIHSLLILQNVLNDIVDYAQINSNQFQLNCTKIDIIQTISDVCEIISLQVKEKAIDFQMKLDPNLSKIFCTDKTRFVQILLNLLRNAIKFSNNKGKIILTVQNSDIIKNNNMILIKVEDTGVGINAAHLANLNSLLETIKNSLNDESFECSFSQMSNLGLVITQNLSLILGPSKMNGLRIASKINEGTTVEFFMEDKVGLTMAEGEVPCISMIKSKTTESNKSKSSLLRKRKDSRKKQTFYWLDQSNIIEENEIDLNERENIDSIRVLPIKQRSNEVQKTIKTSKSDKPCCEKILVVDDDSFNLLSVEIIIKRLGLTCVKAFNGKDAIDIVHNRYNSNRCLSCEGFLIILMDYNMPVMNGIETTIQLKKMMKNKEIPEIPIVACSAFGAKDDITSCFEAGMCDYLSKPISSESLGKIFKKWMKGYDV